MTENVMAAVKEFWKLIVGIAKVFEAILPNSHVLKAAEGLFIGLNPEGCAKGYQ